jgi:hypothetical protein
MSRTHLSKRILATTAVAAAVLSACGDDASPPAGQGTAETVPVPDSTTPSTLPARSDFEHPTGADDVVVEIRYEGGFAPVEMVFTRLPTLLVSGDGRQFEQGAQIAIYPGPLLPNVQVASIGETGIQSLLDLASRHGLLTQRTYESPDNIADAPDTVVTIRANGTTYEHRAYALGLGAGPGGAEEGDRAELAAFVDEAAAASGGDTTPFVPEQYLLRVTPVTDLSGYEIEPTVVDWPAGAPRLADAADATCQPMPAFAVGAVLADADQLTLFEQDDVVYSVLVKPQLPGEGC